MSLFWFYCTISFRFTLWLDVLIVAVTVRRDVHRYITEKTGTFSMS